MSPQPTHLTSNLSHRSFSLLSSPTSAILNMRINFFVLAGASIFAVVSALPSPEVSPALSPALSD